MDTKALASGVVGFLLGGLVVSIAATQLEDEPKTATVHEEGPRSGG